MKWILRFVVALMGSLMILAIIMLATGYVPLDSIGHNAAHELRWGILIGCIGGLGLGFFSGLLVAVVEAESARRRT